MQVRAEALADHLRGTPASVYLIAGDETLLVEEACDAVLKAAESNGYSERRVYFAEAGFDWHEVLTDTQSMSLFAERKVVDVRVRNGKIDRAASDVLRGYLAEPQEDVLLLLRLPRLDRSQRNAAWFKAVDKAGVTVQIWPIDQRGWPRWLANRLANAGLKLDREALALFNELTEGNLLAAVQEIEKLSLAEIRQPITADALAAAMEDASHHEVFELIDAVYAGDARRTARVVDSLRLEGTSPFAVLAVLVSQLRQLEGGGGWMPPQRARAAAQFQSRHRNVPAIIAECALIDQQGKGQLLGDAWLSLSSLLLRLAGEPVMPVLGQVRAAVTRA